MNERVNQTLKVVFHYLAVVAKQLVCWRKLKCIRRESGALIDCYNLHRLLQLSLGKKSELQTVLLSSEFIWKLGECGKNGKRVDSWVGENDLETVFELSFSEMSTDSLVLLSSISYLFFLPFLLFSLYILPFLFLLYIAQNVFQSWLTILDFLAPEPYFVQLIVHVNHSKLHGVVLHILCRFVGF